MKHQPRRLQHGHKGRYLRIHPVQTRNEQDNASQQRSQSKRNNAAPRKQQSATNGSPGDIDHGLIGIAPGRVSPDIPAHRHTDHVKMEHNQNPYAQYPNSYFEPKVLTEKHEKREKQQQTAQRQITYSATAENLQSVIFQLRLYPLRGDIHSPTLCLLVSLNHTHNLVGLCPVSVFQRFLYL